MRTDTDFTLICAPLTVFTEDGALDTASQHAFLDQLKNDGVDGVFTPGTTGEFTGLTDDERLAVIAEALSVFGPSNVFAHVGAATARQAVKLAIDAVGAGAVKLAAITPFFVTAGPEAVIEYFEQIAKAVPEASIYIYVFPDRATTEVLPDTLARLAATPNIVGAKLSGMSTSRVTEYLAAVPSDFEIYSGNDREILALADAGANGVVSGVSGAYPTPFVHATKAINERKTAVEFQAEIDSAVDAVRGGDIGLLKCAAIARGLQVGPLRVSLDPPTADELARIQGTL